MKILNNVGSVALLACLATASAAEFISAPVVRQNPNPAVPLAAVVSFMASAPVVTTVTISDGTRRWRVEFGRDANPEQGLPLVGFYPGKTHAIEVSIRDVGDRLTTAPEKLSFTAPPLPSDATEFPPIQVRTAESAQMEPGWTLLSLRRQRRGGGGGGAGGGGRGGGAAGEPGFATDYGLILALDGRGQVVWYYQGKNRTADVHRLRNGNVAFITNDNRLVEIDLLGNVKGEWCASRRPQGAAPSTSTPVDALTMHHSFAEMPNGHFLLVSGELSEIDNYYTSETDPNAPRKRRKVMGDEVIEFDRSGRVVWRWNAFDHLDVFRFGYLTINQYWAIRGFPDTLDWTHGNGVFFDDRDNSILFNSRQQSAVFKIERPSGRVAWIFGEPGGWAPRYQPLLFNRAEVSEWPWHHHAPRLTPWGTLLVFNNGIMKARPFTPAVSNSEVVSGAMEYSFDPKTRTARLVWASDAKGRPETVNTFAMGDVQPLPKTGNVLVVYGSAVRTDTRLPWSRVREFRHTTPAEVVFDVVFADSNEAPPATWVAFGGERTAGLQ